MTRSSPVAEHQTANDRFKRGFARWFWGALILATLLHAVLFIAAPTFSTQDIAFAPGELSVMELPDEIRIPPPPAAIPRPAAPIITSDPLPVDQDLTIALTTLDANPVETLPPPPARREEAERLETTPVFTPMTVRPTLKNGDEITRLLLRLYPPLLRDAGLGGTVIVWFFIDEDGGVVKTLVKTSSGFDAFDEAALDVAEAMEFTPAYNRDQRVPVWVSIPIKFETLDR